MATKTAKKGPKGNSNKSKRSSKRNSLESPGISPPPRKKRGSIADAGVASNQPPITKPLQSKAPFDFESLFRQCLSRTKWQYLDQAEEEGVVELNLWPLFLEEAASDDAMNSTKDTREDVKSKIDLKKAAYFIALLVNQRSRSSSSGLGGSSGGGMGGALSFVLISSDKQTRVKAFRILITNLIQYNSHLENDIDIQTSKARFLISISNSTCTDSNDIIRPPLLHMLGIGLWVNMPRRYRDLQIRKYAAFRRRWGVYSSSPSFHKHNSDNDNGGPIILEAFLPQLVILFLTTLKQIDSETEQEDTNDHDNSPDTALNFLHTTLELLLDLLSTTTTRRYLRPYLLSINFSVKCTLSTLYKSFLVPNIKTNNSTYAKERARLFVQLVTMLQDSETFGIQDLTAAPLSSAQMASKYHERAHILQKLCHRHHPEQLSEVIYAGVGIVCDAVFLRQKLQIVDLDVIIDLAHRLRLITRGEDESFLKDDDSNRTREFVTEVMLYHHVLRPSELQTLSRLPLYPEESLLWNPHLVPPGHLAVTQKKTSTLALPKLNLQFLTFGDYLLRAFKLLRLESAYEIRSDLVDAIKRMRPVPRHGYHEELDDRMDEDEVCSLQRSKVEFQGWARMGLELAEKEGMPPLRVLKVSPPKLGENIPAEVIAEITIDLRRCGERIRMEWDQIGEFDNLFLVAVDGTAMEGGLPPLLEDSGYNVNKSQNSERRVPDEEDVTFPRRFGVVAVRGCMVLEVRDEDGTILTDPTSPNHQEGQDVKKPKGTKRFLKVALDPAQYAADATENGSTIGTNVYKMLNVVVRRHGRENNFKAVLETIRGLMQGTGSINRSIPSWLRPVLLGYGDPASASFTSSNMKSFARNTPGVTPPDAALDYGDTFLNEEHLRVSFEGSKVKVDGHTLISKKESKKECSKVRKNYKIQMDDSIPHSMDIDVTSYPFPPNVNGNPVRFTPVQVKAIQSGLNPGLTLIVGPPGTGKTDVAVQIIANLYHSFPTQRTILVTHSNAALNDLFEKVMARGDIDERYMLRLGSGERDLQTASEFDFSKLGRVSHILARRSALLEKVQCLSESLGISSTEERGADGSPSYTCETAEYFNLHHVTKRIKTFDAKIADGQGTISSEEDVSKLFPFKKYFNLSESDDSTLTLRDAVEKLDVIRKVFSELAEYRPLELLRSQRQRTDYLLTKQARIVAMTCTHAAIARSHLIELGFQYDNVLMEEAGQMLDVETFVPLLLQKGDFSDGTAYAGSRLKRVCLIGDHHQLPPVVKNASFSRFSNLDQSLFTRLIRLGVPTIELNKQGRSRAEIASLYSWRYQDLGNLEHVDTALKFSTANPGFKHAFQIVNVDDYEGRGESTPTAYFYQNMGEAEYAVALFQYMVLIGYPPEKISLLTTYNGQKELLNDILSQRCGESTPLAGVRPGAVSTVDHYQGQQNDYVILSLVRTNAVGHLRDIRRLVVAVSRARLGLYVLCRDNVFRNCHELRRVMDQFSTRPKKLEIVSGEQYPTTRKLVDDIPDGKVFVIDDVSVMGSIVHSMQNEITADVATVEEVANNGREKASG